MNEQDAEIARLAEALTACQQERDAANAVLAQTQEQFAIHMQEWNAMRADLTACRAQGEAMRAALQNLVTKLDAMQEPLNGICVIGSIHGMPYTGPNWGDEITAARAALSSTPTEPA